MGGEDRWGSVPVHEDVAGEGLAAEGAVLEEVVDVGDVRLVDVEHGRRLHGHGHGHGSTAPPPLP